MLVLTESGNVHVFTYGGLFLTSWRAFPPNGDYGLSVRSWHSLVVDSQRALVLVGTDSCVLAFDLDGRYLSSSKAAHAIRVTALAITGTRGDLLIGTSGGGYMATFGLARLRFDGAQFALADTYGPLECVVISVAADQRTNCLFFTMWQMDTPHAVALDDLCRSVSLARFEFPVSKSACSRVAADETRRRLYLTAAKSTTVQVFDLDSGAFLSEEAVVREAKDRVPAVAAALGLLFSWAGFGNELSVRHVSAKESAFQ